MSIEKNNKNTLQHEENGFTTIINDTILQIRNDTALALYAYLSTKPGDWHICKKHLQNHFEIGRDKVDKAFKYLKKIGALHIVMHRDGEGQCRGWTTVLRRKIAGSIQITENTYSGDLDSKTRTFVDNLRTRSLKNQILDNPDSGKTALTKQRTITKDRKETNRETVSVFSCSKDVQTHLDTIASTKNQTLTDDERSQIMFYIAYNLDYKAVCKLINISLKLIREKRWNIPSGWQGITSKSIANEEKEYERKKQLQIIEDGKIMRDIANQLRTRESSSLVVLTKREEPKSVGISEAASNAFKEMRKKLNYEPTHALG